MAGIRVKLELDADTTRLADTVQKAVAKGFKGGSASGLMSEPGDLISQIMGVPAKGGAKAASLMPEWFLAQAQKHAERMGPLFTPNENKGMFSKWLSNLKGGGGTPIAAFEDLSELAFALAGAVAVVKLFKSAIRESSDAIQNAKRIYTRSFTNGFGINGTQRITNLADVLGVSEKDVFQFGAAISYLSPKLQWATHQMSEANPALTSIGLEIGVMQKNIEAAAATMIKDFTPAILKVISAIDDFVTNAGNWFEQLNGKDWQAAGEFAKQNHLHAARAYVGAPIHFENDKGPLTGNTAKKIQEQFQEFLKGFKPDTTGLAPTPQAFMKQLPVSAFERMGLVIGGFGIGSDYARRTAVATEKTAKLLSVAVVRNGGGSVPRGTFGLNPATSNP